MYINLYWTSCITTKNLFVFRYLTSDGTQREDYRTFRKGGTNLKTKSVQSSENATLFETKLHEMEDEKKLVNTDLSFISTLNLSENTNALEFLGKTNRIASAAIATLTGGGLG